MRTRSAAATMLALAALAIPGAVLASHGKVGLWEMTETVSMAGMLTPEQAARMQAMGVHMQPHSITWQHCMTAKEVAMDFPPPPPRSSKCEISNEKIEGHTYSGDMTCAAANGTGQMQGHMAVTFDSDEHYTGTWTNAGTFQARSMHGSGNFEGRWISSDCGGVQ